MYGSSAALAYIDDCWGWCIPMIYGLGWVCIILRIAGLRWVGLAYIGNLRLLWDGLTYIRIHWSGLGLLISIIAGVGCNGVTNNEVCWVGLGCADIY